MDNSVPSQPLKKRTQLNQKDKKYPIVPMKPTKFVINQSTPNIIGKTSAECLPISFNKQSGTSTQNVTLVAFKNSKTEGSINGSEGLRCSSVSESDESDLSGFKGMLRRSFDRRSLKDKRSGYCDDAATIDELYADLSNNSSTVSSTSITTSPNVESSANKTLRETFDEFKSLMKSSEFSQNHGLLIDKTESNHDKFKRISEIPHFVQSKMDKEFEADSHPTKKYSRNLVTKKVPALRIAPKSAVFENFEVRPEETDEMQILPSPQKENKSPKTPSSALDESFGGYISEDGLSDDGDIILNEDEDELEFSRPSTEVMLHCIPIVPSQQHQVNEKKGYLLKCTTGQVTRLTSKLVTWQKRWVSVDSKFLNYFSSPKESISRRVIPICNMLNVKQIIKPTEQHPYQFKIIMKHKMAISFASDNSDDMSLWTSIIMKFILEASANINIFKWGGIFNLPDMQGFAKLEGARGKKYLACKGDKFAVFNSQSDFERYMPIFMLDLQLLSVRDINKLKLQISTPQSNHVFTFESQEETIAWKQVIESGISSALGDDEVLNKVFINRSNRFCADCGSEGPEWASVSLGITLCQNCAGIHRKMVNSKIKSLRMDFKVWSNGLIEMMKDIGNDSSNKVWENSMKHEDKINTQAELSRRKQFVEDKYHTKKYIDLLFGDEETLKQLLLQGLLSSDLQLVLRAVFSGADVSKIPQELAERKLLQKVSPSLLEFLRQNLGINQSS